jgi:hypothetical protein
LSLPGLTRQSIFFLRKKMDARVKPGHDVERLVQANWKQR